MTERSVPIAMALATMFWTLAVLLGTANVFVGHRYHLAGLAVCCAAAGGTLTIKTWIERSVKHNMQVFKLGKEAQRRESEWDNGGPLRGV